MVGDSAEAGDGARSGGAEADDDAASAAEVGVEVTMDRLGSVERECRTEEGKCPQVLAGHCQVGQQILCALH